MDRARVAPLALALLLFAAGPAAASTAGGSFFAPGDMQPDAVSIVADLHANGDATWTVNYRVRLATDNETQAFHSLQRDIRNNRSAYRRPFAERINATVNASENATGRAMTANNYTIDTSVQGVPEYGVVTYTFDWHGFGTANDTAIRAGDAIAGFYVDNRTTLQISWPNAYHRVSAVPAPDTSTATSVGWSGRHDFTNDQPRVVVTKTSATHGTGGTGGTGGFLPYAVGLALVALAAGAFIAYRAGTLDDLLGDRDGGGDDGGGPAATASDDGGSGSGEDPPPELLSNEEQVERFLEEQGGRAKQQELVAATGWTEAKTSQVLKGMREEGRVESFRIGRENVLRLPEEDESEDV